VFWRSPCGCLAGAEINMTPLQFEHQYQSEWEELEQLLAQLRTGTRKQVATISGAHFAALYRRVCEQLALARARSYPAYLTDRLDQITSDAHQAIYQRREFGLARLKALVARDFPRAVREHAAYVWLATAVFVIPTLVIGLLVYHRPELILSVVDPSTAADFESMYSPDADSIGRTRTVHTDWAMFGHYISNNIGIAFQCFASGLFFGVGSLFFLGFNGAFGGAIGGYLTERGLSETFYSFVVTHAAFELTAIVLSGAAGLRIGYSILAPGRFTRLQSLVVAARESIVIMYGVAGMLLIAAAIEAFWSSATWIPPLIKYGVAAVCWISVLAYLTLQGRRAG
jgi:uncharacterized membrane protein SpoIIM required for sporulation